MYAFLTILKLPRQIFDEALYRPEFQRRCTQIIPLEAFYFLVFVNVMTAYLYYTGNKKTIRVLQDRWTGLNN